MSVAINNIDITQESIEEFLDKINTAALADSLKPLDQQCLYCHPLNKGGCKQLDNFEINGISGGAELSLTDNTLWYHVNDKNQSLTASRFKIKFCPMCGRQLIEGEEQ